MTESLLIFCLISSVLILLSFAYSGLFQRPFEETVGLSVFSAILILFVFGLFGKLKSGAVFFVIFSAAFFLFVFFGKLVKKQAGYFGKNLFTPGFLIFLILLILIFHMSSGRLLSQYDEFTHWGLTIKNYMIFDGYANIPGSTTHGAGYGPGLSLFSYLFTVFRGITDESLMIMGANVYVISLLLPVFKKTKWKDIFPGIFLLAFIVVLPWLFSPSIKPFNTLLADCPMAVTFAWLLFAYFTGGQNRFTYFSLALSSPVLIIIKPGSEEYALMILGIIFLDILFFRRTEFRRFWKKKKGWIMILLYPATSAAAYLTWRFFTLQNNMMQVMDYVEVSGENTVSAKTIAENFLKALTAPKADSVVPVSFALWVIIFLGFAVLLVILSKGAKERLRTGLYSFLVMFGYAAYAVALLFMYVYLFSDYEGATLASMDRYMYTYIMGAVIFYLYMLAIKLMEFGNGWKKLLVLVPAVGVFLLAPWGKIDKDMINCSKTVTKTVSKREAYEGVEELPEFLDYKKDRVYFIAQQSHGYEYQVSYYLATPIPLTYDFEMGWSLGAPYDENDVWTLDFSVSEWEKVLTEGGYTYVYIYRCDDRFIERYGTLFENREDIKDNSCFRITRQGGKTILRNGR